MSPTETRTLLTVPEAAVALRIGRSTAYDLAHAWLDSGGTKGLPVVVIGGSLRVPVAALDRLFAIGGFGPAWQSGRGGRRTSRNSASAPIDSNVSAIPPVIAERGAVPKSGAVAGCGGSVPISDAGPASTTPTATKVADAELRQRTSHRTRHAQRSSSKQLSLFDAPDI